MRTVALVCRVGWLVLVGVMLCGWGASLRAQEIPPGRPNEVRFNVLGAVREPGQFRSDGQETLLGALALARGWTERADLSQIVVRRRPPDGGLRPQIVRINLQDVWAGEVLDFLLEPGDTILVPERPRPPGGDSSRPTRNDRNERSDRS